MNRRWLSAGLTVTLVALIACFVQPGDGTTSAQPPAKASWWKGNLHTHSLWSDGDDLPENIAAWYRENGYNFLALTDHNKLSEGSISIEFKRDKANYVQAADKARKKFGDAWVEITQRDGKEWIKLKTYAEIGKKLDDPGKFLMVQGEEITHSFKKSPVHMNGINLKEVIKPIDGPSHEETVRVNLRQVADQQKRVNRPILAFLNHPNFGWGVRAEDMAPVDELGFFEVFNGHSGVRNYGDEKHASTERIWDIVLALRLGKLKLPMLHGLATDDSHAYHVFGIGKTNPGRGWVMVRADKLEADDLVRSLQVGNFYASSGVLLDDVRREKDEWVIAIKTQPGVTYTTEIIGTMKGVPLDSEAVQDAEGKELTRKYSDEIGKVLLKSNATEVRYKVTGKEMYVRARVTSSRPHPNPYAKGDFEMAWIPPMVP